jgi:zinc D-Ala-D-Ala carboxypeptidase
LRPGLVCRTVGAVALATILGLAYPSAAWAYSFDRALTDGSRGKDVYALEMRIAGWYPARSQRLLRVDRYFGKRTILAVKGFQRRYGLTVDGVAGPQTFAALGHLDDADGSTRHFSWREFAQHTDANCRRANRYGGTYHGGPIPAKAVKRHIRQVMWRLEAIRSKLHAPIVVESGFRSTAYNRCIGGATVSQHMYGYAVDYEVPAVPDHIERRVAKRSQIHGISCYSSLGHTHIDLRYENHSLPALHHWWWPDLDNRGRFLADDGRLCRGE